MKSFKLVRASLKNRKFAFGLPPTPKPEAVPASMAGQYVVWSPDGLRIIGHGKTIAEARDMAGPSRGARQVIQKIPAVRRFRPANGKSILAIDKTEAVDPAKV